MRASVAGVCRRSHGPSEPRIFSPRRSVGERLHRADGGSRRRPASGETSTGLGGHDERGRLAAVIGLTYAMPTVLRELLLKFINKSIHLFVRDRRLDWEIHIDDTPRDQWTVEGIPLLDSGSDEEKCWILREPGTPSRSHLESSELRMR